MEWMLMPLKRYADFSGRSRRMEFWMWQLFKFLVFGVIMIAFFAMFGAAFTSLASSKDPSAMAALGGGFIILMLICMILGLGIFIPDIAVQVRRLHDTDRTGWWILAPIGPYLVAIILVAMTAAVSGPEPGAMMAVAGVVAFVCMLATLVLSLVLLVFYFLEGTAGPNRFGADPKAQDVGKTFS